MRVTYQAPPDGPNEITLTAPVIAKLNQRYRTEGRPDLAVAPGQAVREALDTIIGANRGPSARARAQGRGNV